MTCAVTVTTSPDVISEHGVTIAVSVVTTGELVFTEQLGVTSSVTVTTVTSVIVATVTTSSLSHLSPW